MGSTFGHLFRVTTFGESHGGGVGVVVDGCPPRLPLTRRGDPARPRPPPARPEHDHHAARRARPRRDPLRPVRGADARARRSPSWCATPTRGPSAYADFKDTYRPSHADYTYEAKYGIRNWQGGGRASARETIGRVAAGADRAQAARAPSPTSRCSPTCSRCTTIDADDRSGDGDARRRRGEHRALPGRRRRRRR